MSGQASDSCSVRLQPDPESVAGRRRTVVASGFSGTPTAIAVERPTVETERAQIQAFRVTLALAAIVSMAPR